jgi:hypothetical protein
MSTVHDVVNEPPCWRPIEKRPTASTQFAQSTVDGSTEIPYPQINFDYNHNMNGSDLYQQVWNVYTTSGHYHLRNWWPLFRHLINTSICNTLFLYRLKGYTDRDLTHYELQERLGLQLLRNPAAVNRIVDSTLPTQYQRPTVLTRPHDEHSWTRTAKRYCKVRRPPPLQRGPGRRKRAVRQEMGINIGPRTPQTTTGKRKRSKQTTWACFECEEPLCHSS